MSAYQAAGGAVMEDRHSPVFHLSPTPDAILDTARQFNLPMDDQIKPDGGTDASGVHDKQPDAEPPGTNGGAHPQAPDTGMETTTRQQIRRICIRGSIAPENWADIFRSFVNPAVRMSPEDLYLGIDFEIKRADDRPLDAHDPIMRAMREAARQLGLTMDEA